MSVGGRERRRQSPGPRRHEVGACETRCPVRHHAVHRPMEVPMRRLPALVVTTALSVLAATGVAAAADPVPVNNQPFTLPQQTTAANGKVAGFCPGFAVHVHVVRDTEVATTTTTPPPDKTVVTLVTGTLIERYANVATGKTITRNVSGDTTTTVAPNGIG